MEKVCCDFCSYLIQCESIFDIMALAYKILLPFGPGITMGKDEELTKIVSGFVEQDNNQLALKMIKSDLVWWYKKQRDMDLHQFKEKLYWLILLIDTKCAGFIFSSLPDTYEQCGSLNDFLHEEIIVFPRFRSTPMEILSKEIADQDGKGGFYGRYYAKTADISGYIHNYIIFCPKSNIRPVLHIPSYYKEIGQRIKENNYQLKIGIFPLSNMNLDQIFEIDKEMEEENENGLFRRLSEIPLHGQDKLLLSRCKDAFQICKEKQVDIAVFPEMIFNRQMQEEIREYVKGCRYPDAVPLFTWMGTAWEKGSNQCMVIDQYGKVVFEQKKHVPYEFKVMLKENNTDEDLHADKKKEKRITFREKLEPQSEWQVHFLDLPGFFRIATAICRDISDDYLGALLKEIYCDMLIIPAFSSSDRLTKPKIDSLAIDHIITVVCNACSALCGDKQEKYTIQAKQIGRAVPFCYVCVPAKEAECNVPDYHRVTFKEACISCDQCCEGHVYCISFAECVKKNNYFTAKVICE